MLEATLETIYGVLVVTAGVMIGNYIYHKFIDNVSNNNKERESGENR